jgi:hypothetical protein
MHPERVLVLTLRKTDRFDALATPQLHRGNTAQRNHRACQSRRRPFDRDALSSD